MMKLFRPETREGIEPCVGEVEVSPGKVYRTWLYNEEFPIRVREGERLRIAVENRLPEGTTAHCFGGDLLPRRAPLKGAAGGAPRSEVAREKAPTT